jgi:uncharacterized protein
LTHIFQGAEALFTAEIQKSTLPYPAAEVLCRVNIMDPENIISQHYKPASLSYVTLMAHSRSVAKKAVEKARQLHFTDSEIGFIWEASMLHDIGICFTSAPDIGCFGSLPYICHGFKGHDLLMTHGLIRHALVCERHTGTGLSLADIDRLNGLLPRRPMEPVSTAEKLIAYCDKFFSKDPLFPEEEMPIESILKGIIKYGEQKVSIFMEWHHQFNP